MVLESSVQFDKANYGVEKWGELFSIIVSNGDSHRILYLDGSNWRNNGEHIAIGIICHDQPLSFLDYRKLSLIWMVSNGDSYCILCSMGSEIIEVDLYRMHAGCLKLEWIYAGMLEIWSSSGFRIAL